MKSDEIFIYNTSGTRIIEYTYDAYGNCTVSYGYSNEISRINPIRYRGYYLDRETGLYYLNARYYNAEWRRFISPANVSALNPKAVNGLNLYVYQNSQPITMDITNCIPTRVSGTINSHNNSYYWYFLDNTLSTPSVPSLYNLLGNASNIFAVINGIKTAEYVKHIHGNPPHIGWFLDNVSKFNTVAGIFSVAAAVVDSFDVYYTIGDLGTSIYTGMFDLGSAWVASKLGAALGGVIGGPAGAIVGTLAIIMLEEIFQTYKEPIVKWIDQVIDSFINNFTGIQGELSYA